MNSDSTAPAGEHYLSRFESALGDASVPDDGGTGELNADERFCLGLRLRHALKYADLEPSSLPPRALLFVRRIKDPLPGRSTRVDAAAPRAATCWEGAMRDSLADAHRRAERPWQRPVSPTCDAVLFEDEAEMLACLLRDLALSRAQMRWWWRALHRVLPAHSPDAIAAACRERPTAIASALMHLVRSRDDAAVLGVLGPAQLIEIFAAMSEAVGVTALSVRQRFAELARCDSSPDRRLARRHPPDATGADTGNDIAQPSPAPETPPRASENGSSADVRALSRIRADAIADEVTFWDTGIDRFAIPFDLPDAHQALLGTALLAHRRPGVVAHPSFARRLEEWLGARIEARSRLLLVAPGQRDRDEQMPRGCERAGDLRGDALSSLGVPGSDAIESASRGEVASGVETDLGGLLFLIHPLRERRLLDGADRACPWGGWALIELVGRSLLDDDAQRFGSDPLWRILAILDGRRPNDALLPSPSPALDVVIEAVRLRLETSLSLQGAPVGSLTEALLHRRGRLYVTSAHIDLVMPIDDASVPIRLAGLDADPGWVSGLGRVVTFHYVARAIS